MLLIRLDVFEVGLFLFEFDLCISGILVNDTHFDITGVFIEAGVFENKSTDDSITLDFLIGSKVMDNEFLVIMFFSFCFSFESMVGKSSIVMGVLGSEYLSVLSEILLI